MLCPPMYLTNTKLTDSTKRNIKKGRKMLYSIIDFNMLFGQVTSNVAMCLVAFRIKIESLKKN
jgi:hypothetical protein